MISNKSNDIDEEKKNLKIITNDDKISLNTISTNPSDKDEKNTKKIPETDQGSEKSVSSNSSNPKNDTSNNTTVSSVNISTNSFTKTPPKKPSKIDPMYQNISPKISEQLNDEKLKEILIKEIDLFQKKSLILLDSLISSGTFSHIFLGEQKVSNGNTKKYVVKIVNML